MMTTIICIVVYIGAVITCATLSIIYADIMKNRLKQQDDFEQQDNDDD